MTYELALQLKKAGFPQKAGMYLHEDGLTGNTDRNGSFYKGGVFIPTLSEIIEACGADFPSLSRVWGDNSEGEWICNKPQYDCGSDGEITRGSTPEVAVAKLWLVLNRK